MNKSYQFKKILEYRRIIFFSKVILSLLLVFWLVQKDEMSYENIKTGVSNYPLFLIFIVLTLFQLALGAIRMTLLMQFNSPRRVVLKQVFFVMWASSFIASVAPIAFIGEAYKIKELISLDPVLNKDNSYYAAIFSKLFSILSLLFITAITGLAVVNQPNEIKDILIAIQFGLLLAFAAILYKKSIINTIESFWRKIQSFNRSELLKTRVRNFFIYNTIFIEGHKRLVFVILLSLGIQFLNVSSFAFIIYSINPGLNVDLINFVYVIPLGIIAMMLPISVSGLGIGHIAFSQLLIFYSIPNGADVFSIFFIFSYVFNLIGLVPFIKLLIKKKMFDE